MHRDGARSLRAKGGRSPTGGRSDKTGCSRGLLWQDLGFRNSTLTKKETTMSTRENLIKGRTPYQAFLEGVKEMQTKEAG